MSQPPGLLITALKLLHSEGTCKWTDLKFWPGEVVEDLTPVSLFFFFFKFYLFIY